MIVVDTNILVYAADADSPWHVKTRDWIEQRRGRPDAWYVTWSILYEFIRVTTHPRVMRKPWTAPQAMTFVSALLELPGLGILVATERHARVAAQVVTECSLAHRQSHPRRAHRDFDARAWRQSHLHARRGFPPLSFRRGGRWRIEFASAFCAVLRMAIGPETAARKQKGGAKPPFSIGPNGTLSAWRTGSSRAPCGGRTSCARPRANRG